MRSVPVSCVRPQGRETAGRSGRKWELRRELRPGKTYSCVLSLRGLREDSFTARKPSQNTEERGVRSRRANGEAKPAGTIAFFEDIQTRHTRSASRLWR